MTGTAQTEAAELHQTYKLGVVPIPTNRPMVREDRSDVIYKTEKAKFEAVVEDIAERNEAGQPVLVGTASVEKSEVLSKFLLARHPARGAQRQEPRARGADRGGGRAARRGHRGDQHGRPRYRHPARRQPGVHRRRGAAGPRPLAVGDAEEYEAAWDDALEAAKQQVKAEHEEVIETGGSTCWAPSGTRAVGSTTSCVAGPAARATRGVPLLPVARRRPDAPFNGPMLESMMTTLRVPDDQPIESKMVTRAILSAQTQVEQQNHEVRKDVLKYDEVLNRQRTVIYDERRKVLEGADLHEQVRSMVDDVIAAYADGATETGCRGLGPRAAVDGLKALYPVGLSIPGARRPRRRGRPDEPHARGAQAGAARRRAPRVRGARGQARLEVMRELERRVLLSVLDRKWREHLYEMDYLRAGIHLRAMANRDPVVEYQREGYDMFMAMLDGIKEESVGFLFNLEVKTKEEQEAEAKAKQDEAEAAALAAAQEGTARVLARRRPRRRRPPGTARGRRLRRLPHRLAGPGRRRRPHRLPPRLLWSRRRSRRAPVRAGGQGARRAAPVARAAAVLGAEPGRVGEGAGPRRPPRRRRCRARRAGAQRPCPADRQEVQVLPRSHH